MYRGDCRENHASTFVHALCNKAIVHQVTTMLTTSENALFSGHNHLLTTGTDDTSLAGAQVIIKVSVISTCQQVVMIWNRTLLEVVSMVVTWWIVAFLTSDGSTAWKYYEDNSMMSDHCHAHYFAGCESPRELLSGFLSFKRKLIKEALHFDGIARWAQL